MHANCSCCQGINLRNILIETDYVASRVTYKMECTDCGGQTTVHHNTHPKVEKIKTNCPKCFSHEGTVLNWYYYQSDNRLEAKIQCDHCSHKFKKTIKEK